ncbi:MAG: Gfo/Idh/MocA family oxidoreductase [Armatimonadota bacterium]|nr:Gfo/Idh/MocA family oxidoreductase [Armatimonadota bacterium]
MTVQIGILSFAHMHAASYANCLASHSEAALCGIADPDGARGRAMAARFATTFYASDEALLEQGLDGVVVASENAGHRALVEKAVAAGVKAIICEKPLATTPDDARAMVDLCADKGVKLATAFPCRYSPAFQRLRQQVQAGAIGDVVAIRGTNRGSMPGGWFTDRTLSGGGAVIDHTVHVADLNRWLLGREAVEVYAEIGSGFYHQEWDDTGFLTIAYDGGIFATLDTSWSRPKTYPTWGDVTMQVVGTGGVIDLDIFAQNLNVYDDRVGRGEWQNWGSNIDAGLVADFVRLAGGREAPELATGEDGLRALEVAAAAYRSAETGQPVSLSTIPPLP